VCTIVYFWLASRLESWEDEPLCSCIGLCLFVLFDVYFASEILRAIMEK